MKLLVAPKRSVWRRGGERAALGLGIGLLAFTPVDVQAQAPAPSAEASGAVTAPNAVIFELLGNALLYSVNYERALKPHVGVRVGVMHIRESERQDNGFGYGDDVTLVPLMVHYLTGARNKHLEIGGGIVFAHGNYRSEGNSGGYRNAGSAAYGTVTFGYRYQKPAGRNIFRVGVTPVFDASGGLPWLGISYGRRW